MRVKKLEWNPVEQSGATAWYAETPMTDTGRHGDQGIYVHLEDGKYWAGWDLRLPPQETLQEAQKLGELAHIKWVTQFLEFDSAEVEEIAAERRLKMLEVFTNEGRV